MFDFGPLNAQKQHYQEIYLRFEDSIYHIVRFGKLAAEWPVKLIEAV